MRKSRTPPDEWIAHRKLRKKIASARWYLKKKQLERREEFDREQYLRAQNRKLCDGSCPIWTPEQLAQWRCTTSFMFHGWPKCPASCSPVHWCELMDIAQAAIQSVQTLALYPWSIRKSHLVQRLTMAELYEAYVQADRSTACIHSRANASLSCSHSLRDNEHVACLDVESTPSNVLRRILCGDWFPTVCTGVGLLFVQVALLGQLHRWSSMCRHMYQVYMTNTTSDQYIVPNPPQTSPPIQNPMQNACLQDPMVQQWIQELTNDEQVAFTRHTHAQSPDSVSPSSDESDSSHSSSFASCHSLDSYFRWWNIPTNRADDSRYQSDVGSLDSESLGSCADLPV
jgi:hypothetical protein